MSYWHPYNVVGGGKVSKKKLLFYYIAIGAGLLIIVSIIVGLCVSKGNDKDNPTPSLPLDSNAEDWNGQQQLPSGNINTGKNICIPGFDSLVFFANQTRQKVNFYNPEVNADRLFKMTLIVGDTVCWQSGYCPPGSGYYEIDLTEPIEPGEYKAYLRIQCFKPDGTELNGAKVSFNLLVEEESK